MATSTTKTTKTTAKNKEDTKNGRKFFNKSLDAIDLPDQIEHQVSSFKDFVTRGLGEVLSEFSSISDYTGEKMELKLLDYAFDDPEVSELEARTNNTTFEASLKIRAELINKATGEVKEAHIYMGQYPWMTERGSFVINGAERVVVGQLVRSPGVMFSMSESSLGKRLYSAKINPVRGSWMEFETAANGTLSVKIDKRRKIPLTTFLKATGFASNKEIEDTFKDVNTGEVNYIKETIKKDNTNTQAEALIEVFSRLRPGEMATVDNAKSLIESMLFNFKRFDLGKVGRYKMNRRLGLEAPFTPEGRVLRKEDLVATIKELIRLNISQEAADDMDSLANRRVRLVGELLEQQFRKGLLRLEKNIKDRMTLADVETATPVSLVNSRPVVASVHEFYNTGQLSQYMEQTNALRELSNKRRITSLGTGGLTRERAGFEVRDTHSTHYGRICTIETPEGPNIGLVLTMASYARINEFGFIEAPYRKVVKGKITDEVEYLDVEAEKNAVIASSNIEVNEAGKITSDRVAARVGFKPEEVDVADLTHIDASQSESLGTSAALIPFIETNEAKRALMGANMQRQAVPLIKTESPIVGTGLEHEVAKSTGQLVVADEDGEVTYSDANKLNIKYKSGTRTYEPQHFVRSNDGTSINQKVVVKTGDKVKKGQPLIEGMSVASGELALGKDVLVAFMPWEGYNFEDSIVISERLVRDDEYTSIHIEDFQLDVRETKLGREQVSRDIPNASEESLRHLDEFGIVSVGAEVKAGDILVGKITPKGETELSGEERLLRAIFGDNAKDVKDTSLRMPNGKSGKVVDVKIFTREGGHNLRSDVLMQVQVFVAHMAKVEVGDKFAGRYGNKGTIAKILPVEDMPFTEDGQPVDMVLTPLGVPSRMNLGQVFEMHLSLAAKALGYKVASPSFNRVTTEQIKSELKKAGFEEDGKVQLFDGRTGEAFEERTAIGYMHMLKLEHMIENKIHARSIGPYTKVTQQPLGGKAQFGGQRFGEMEVWALEAFGAANVLQEMLTIKSDDMVGRSKAYESLVKSRKIVSSKLPESFKVLVSELQGLGLDVQLVGDRYEATHSTSNQESTTEAEDLIEDIAQQETPVSSEVEEAIEAESSLSPNDIDVSGLSSDFTGGDGVDSVVSGDNDDDTQDLADEIESKVEEDQA
ncbi:MAG: DNA-directed RNA polymerase subunit beta [Candidatus Nomurabacteria bacterium]|nr:MAG: DNA-directed RNA polymerase subunit beta [Candidatus Nomurabacteria bacterium]